jgi:hypothetical protein
MFGWLDYVHCFDSCTKRRKRYGLSLLTWRSAKAFKDVRECIFVWPPKKTLMFSGRTGLFLFFLCVPACVVSLAMVADYALTFLVASK